MKTKNLLKKAFLLLALIGGASSAWASTVDDLATISSDYTFIGQIVGEGAALASGTLYDSNKIISLGGSGYAENKGKTIIDGNSYYNCYQVKSNRQIAFKVSGACTLKLYGESNSGRMWQVGSTSAGTEYGTSTESISEYSITSAGVVYINCDNQLYLAGFKVTFPSSDAPTITTQPASATYVVDASPAALTVEASASAGDLSYQWYKNTDQDKTAKEADKIAGATSATLEAANISTAAVGTTYYYVVVTDGNGSTTSDLATITVVTGIAPDVSAAISASAVRAGTTVTLTATVNAGTPAPTLQWYTCDSDGSNESPIDGATNTTYQPSTASTGTYYFKVKAHNDSGDDYSDVVTLTVIAQGVKGAVGDLETISSNYTFIADNHTGNGVVGFTSGYLYDDSRIFSPLGNAVATNKGKSTIDGVEYFNSLRVKTNSQDVLAFKVGGACVVTFYTENPLKSPARVIKVGNAVNDESYGTITDANEEHTIHIPSATTVYLTGTGDRFIAGFKVTFTVTATIGSTGWTTFSSGYALDLSNMTASTGTVTAYYASETSAESVIMTPTNSSAVIANEGLMLKGTAGATITIPVVATGSALPGNKLVGCYNGETLSKDASKYVLVNNSGTAVFQSLEDNGATIPAGKAYLDVSLASPARALRIAFASDITGINEAEATTTEAVAQEGKFIENGKLVIVKNGKKFNANGAILK